MGDISGEVTPVAPLALMDFKNEGSRGGGGGGGDSHTCIIRKLILKCEYIVLFMLLSKSIPQLRLQYLSEPQGDCSRLLQCFLRMKLPLL